MILSDKRIGIIGLQRTGIATAQTLLKRGARVVAVDRADEHQLPREIQALREAGAVICTGNHDCPELDRCDLIVPSPGVPLSIEPIVRARRRGVPVLSEIEIAYRLCPAPIAAITGTNGKTTTTLLLGQMLHDCGMATVVAGNIGVPLIKELDRVTADHLVILEVSSFQLEAIELFRPKFGVLLNLAPDHLDRYENLDEYLEAKWKLLANQREDDIAVLNRDDALVWRMSNRVRGRTVAFSASKSVDASLYFEEDGRMVSTLQGSPETLCTIHEIPAPLRHNADNMMAAAATALLAGADSRSVAETILRFRGVEHRLEPVATRNEVTFINDSKATNVHASLHALQATPPPIILVAGGRVKEPDFTQWAASVQCKAKALLLIGEGSAILEQAARQAGVCGVERCATLEEAVRRGDQLGEPGDTVLFSPACASYDMFRDYEHRGAEFKRCVLALEERTT